MAPQRQDTPPTERRSWLRRSGALLCLATVLMASGVHTLALQTYGWVRMYEAYRTSLSPAAALELTFSGDELCGICVLSQSSLDTLNENLSLALNEQHLPLVSPSEPQATLREPGATYHQLRHPPTRCPNEIPLEFEPPPPRLA